MSTFHMRMSAVAVCCAIAGTALGGIDTPPPWAGTGIVGNSTHWHWDFHPGPAPEVGTGFGPPNGQPPIVTGGQPVPTLGDGAWVLQPGQGITIDLFNFPNTNDFKLIWIQFHLLPIVGALVQPPVVQVTFGSAQATPWGPGSITPTPDGGIIVSQGFQFPFNPPFEIIQIFNNTQVPMAFEWLTIDTICAPTPGAAGVLALGGVALARRRNRSA